MNWTIVLMRLFYMAQGYQIKELKRKSELKTAFDLKNKINQELYGLPLLPEEDDFMYPKGAAYIVGIYKKKQLIGSVQLMDLTRSASYFQKAFSKAEFTHNPSTTYEVKALVVHPDFQDISGEIYKILIYYCMQFSHKTNRNKWLVVTSGTFYYLIKRSRLKLQMISKDNHLEIDDTTQSRYFQNYLSSGIIDELWCYYIEVPKEAVGVLVKKFLRRQLKRKWKRFRENVIPQFSY